MMGLVTAGIGVYALALFGRTAEVVAEPVTPAPTATPSRPSPELPVPASPAPAPVSTRVAASPATRLYALGLHELPGLEASAPPGTRLEIWVAWEPPITKEPEVQLLIDQVVLEKIVPPLTPEGPTAAILSVPAGAFRDLVYGDRYGHFNAAILP